MGLLNKLYDQINMFDGGKTFNSPKAQPAPRQNVPVKRFEDGSAKVGQIGVPVGAGHSYGARIGSVGDFTQQANGGHRYEDQLRPGIPMASKFQNVGNYQQDDINGINPQGFNYGIRGIADFNAVQPFDNDAMVPERMYQGMARHGMARPQPPVDFSELLKRIRF